VGKFKDLTGKLYGRWTVGVRGHISQGSYFYNCTCSCGVKKLVLSNRLVSGASQSCGCLHKELLVNRSTKHGMRYRHLYHAVSDEMRRCRYPSHPAYHNYGGRGIKFNFPSLKDAIHWIENNLPIKPTPKHTIDRIDNDGHYEPGNLRWATKAEQRANQREYFN